MFMYDHKNTKQNYDTKIVDSTQRNKSCNNKQINSRLNSGNACYQSDKNILSSSLPSRDINIKGHKTVLYETGTLYLTLEENGLRVFKNRTMRRVLENIKGKSVRRTKKVS